jgi:tRNA G37 N-methylase TrmD
MHANKRVALGVKYKRIVLKLSGEVLRGGNHAQIERWRLAQALHRTIAKRPDLMAKRGPLTQTEQRLLEEFPPVPYPSHFTI